MIDYKIVSNALEISLALIREADHTWFRTDEQGIVFVKEPLFSTMKTIIRLMNANGIIDVSRDPWAFPEGYEG
jgi:hypothetical protein